MTEIVDFINQVAAAQASEASESLDNLISQRAFQSLDDKKTEIAKNMFADVSSMSQDDVNNPDVCPNNPQQYQLILTFISSITSIFLAAYTLSLILIDCCI